ncbi:MAG: mechanosensitive ion channel domain-containing protein [Bacteroidota bacterium]
MDLVPNPTLFTSFSLFLYLLMLGLLIYGFFWAGRRYLIPLMQNQGWGWVKKFIPSLEAFAWLSYMLVVVFYILRANFQLGLVFVVLIIAGGWVIWRDFVPGLLIRSGGAYRPGQEISFGDFEGTILNMGLLGVDVEIADGENLLIPYHKFSDKLILKKSPSEKLRSHAFELEVVAESAESEVQKLIRQRILSLPWSLQDPLPIITLKQTQEGRFVYHIVIFSVHDRYLPRMKAILASSFQLEEKARKTRKKKASLTD